MAFIDTHQHLIYRDRFGYGWADEIPPLATGDFTVADYQALTKDQGILGTIFMEAAVGDGEYINEARFVASLLRQPGNGILGQIASCRPESDDGFANWLEQSSDLGVVGYRRILHVMPDEVSQTETFRANIRRIGQAGLPFDMCFQARQLPIARALARACDSTRLVLDHCGVPDIAGGEMAPWVAEITALAALPNVVCKLSGISAYCAPGTANLGTLRPWVDHVLTAFGPDRVLWGGDWPVVNLGAGLPDWIALTRELLSGLSADETAEVAHRTARKIYALSA